MRGIRPSKRKNCKRGGVQQLNIERVVYLILFPLTLFEDLCIISGCILSGKCAVKPGPADIHIDSYRQTYSLHKTSECITDRGNDGDSANHITASLRYRIYFADFADRIACGYNCIGNQEYV